MAATGNGRPLSDHRRPFRKRKTRTLQGRRPYGRLVGRQAARASLERAAFLKGSWASPPKESAKTRGRGAAFRAPGTGKVLLFRNILDSDEKEQGSSPFHQGVFYLASALLSSGIPVVLSDLKVSRLDEDGPHGLKALGRLLKAHPDINLAGLTLLDSYFEEARRLLIFLRSRTRAFLAVGGLMPTLNPREVFAHLPEAHLVVRGAGEEVLPRIMGIVGSSHAGEGLNPNQRRALSGLEGTLFGDAGGCLWAGAHRVLRILDLDRSGLDFSLLERRNVASGHSFSLSRGCRYGCTFCTSMDKGRFSGKSSEDFGRLLAAYGRRLRELYGSWAKVPQAAFGIGFYDDDFFSDGQRAAAILRIAKKSPFFVRFLQTAINSFFLKRGGRPSDELDDAVLDSLDQADFMPKFGRGDSDELRRPFLYIGTESFCDRELERLGKGYRYEKVEKAALALSRRGIRQAHHFIVSNVRTTIEDLLESLSRIVRLEKLCGEPFEILEPVIPHLMSFYPTASYLRLERDGLLGQVELRGTLRLKGYPEFDYPLVERDVPLDPDVREFAERIAGARDVDWLAELDGLLLKTLLKSEEIGLGGGDDRRGRRLRQAADRFHRYHELAKV